MFVVVPDLHAASRNRHFELSYEKTFKLDATFVSDLHSGSEKQAYLEPYIWRGVLTLSLGIIFFTFHLELFHWIVY